MEVALKSISPLSLNSLMMPQEGFFPEIVLMSMYVCICVYYMWFHVWIACACFDIVLLCFVSDIRRLPFPTCEALQL